MQPHWCSSLPACCVSSRNLLGHGPCRWTDLENNPALQQYANYGLGGAYGLIALVALVSIVMVDSVLMHAAMIQHLLVNQFCTGSVADSDSCQRLSIA
jgi:hypothetical protein